MNYITIPIYGRPFRFPSYTNPKTENSGTGLCNQLFHLMIGINRCNFEHDVLYCDYFSKDYKTGDLLNYSELFDFVEMNTNNKWNLQDLTNLKQLQDYMILPNGGGMWELYYHNNTRFVEIAKKLVFNKTWVDLAKQVIKNAGIENEKVNLIHLRIDSDLQDHLKRQFPGNFEKVFNDYLSRYKQTIQDHCEVDKKLVLLLEDIHHPLVKEIQQKYNVIFFSKENVNEAYSELYNKKDFNGREMFALIDLLIGKCLNVDKYIHSDGPIFNSSFSVLLKYLNNFQTIIAV